MSTSFDWDDEDVDGNTRHVISAGYDPVAIEDAISGHAGPLEVTSKTRRSMIRTVTPDGEEVIVVFEVDADGDVVVVRSITAFPRED